MYKLGVWRAVLQIPARVFVITVHSILHISTRTRVVQFYAVLKGKRGENLQERNAFLYFTPPNNQIQALLLLGELSKILRFYPFVSLNPSIRLFNVETQHLAPHQTPPPAEAAALQWSRVDLLEHNGVFVRNQTLPYEVLSSREEGACKTPNTVLSKVHFVQHIPTVQQRQYFLAMTLNFIPPRQPSRRVNTKC